MNRVTALLIAALILAPTLGARAAGVTFNPGWDFSLPAEVKPEPYAGLLFMGQRANRTEIIHEGYTLLWSEMNPASGKYDFSRPRRLLDAAHMRGCGVLFRMDTFVTHEITPWGQSPPAVPAWAISKHTPAIIDMAGGDDATYPGVVINIAAPWNAGLHADHIRFIAALGRSGIPDHPALLGFYVHGISTSLGEEFWFTRTAYHNLAAGGMTPENLERYFSERLRSWAKAFGKHPGRLAWVGAGWMDVPDDGYDAYAKVGRDLNALAIDLGMGLRGGGIERYNEPHNLGNASPDEPVYLTYDPDNPIVRDRRYYGDENEIYNVDDPVSPHMYRSATLRALQLGMRFLWVSDRVVALDPAVSDYFNRVAGKPPADSPDAWCALREAKVKRGRRIYTFRNFERLLSQREANEFRTRPTTFIKRPRHYYDTDKPGEWTARSTDTANGQTGIGLTLHPKFWNDDAPVDVTLKVTYRDDGGKWRVDYSTQDGIAHSPTITESNRGLVTATIPLRGFVPRRAIAGTFDLALMAADGDLVSHFVRIVR